MSGADDETPSAAATAAVAATQPANPSSLTGSSTSPARAAAEPVLSSLTGSATSPAGAAADPALPPATDPCPFCLEPLVGSGALALPCGHAFHSVCALQFLLRKQQCPVCRAPVDETLVRDVGELPECSGRSFVQHQASSRADSGSKAGRPHGGGGGHIQLQAFAGSSSSPAAARPPWLPDAHPTQPPGQPVSGPVRVTLGDQNAFDGVAAAAAGTGSRTAPTAPLHTIRVVRPRPAWVRLVLLGLLVSGIVAVLVAIPLAFGRDGPPRYGPGGGGGGTSSGGAGDDVSDDCLACLFNDNVWDCRSACWGT
ncbi:hypothetical protein D9Q98_007798 [Chlorella vulgaris]|uniref:RING-type domain-containing protein n=1 Tax=Chlorella vulgaris TaxID=3077 RepID=A0A9D4THH1_CHLVU|nr:hypothetical protein D9Q98_007798 [Chlorella vulgaris]